MMKRKMMPIKPFDKRTILAVVSCSIVVFYTSQAFADKIYLEAPPLLWEEQAPKKEIDQQQYYQDKYGAKPKSQENLESQAETSLEDKKLDNPEPTMNQATGITEGFGVGMIDNMTNPTAGTENENSGSVVVPENEQVKAYANGEPECDYEQIEGSNVADIDFDVFEGRPVRVVFPNQQITMDMNPKRVNLKVNLKGIVTKVSCF